VALNPVILVVHEDRESREIIKRDLTKRYGGDYEVLSADEPHDAIHLLDRLAADRRPVSVMIAHLRMHQMDGIELLSRARRHHAGVMRVLTIGVGDRQAERPIVRALTLNQIDFYLGMPWASPEEELYPVLAEAVRVWARAHLPRYERAKVIGDPASAIVRSLTRRAELMNTAYGVYPPDSAEGAALMRAHGLGPDDVPVAILYDGRVVHDPSPLRVALALGAPTLPAGSATYDVTVVGAGPAGLAAAMYAASEGLGVLVLETATPGGQAGSSSMIRNYLGFPWGVAGADLAERGIRQAAHFGARFAIAPPARSLRTDADERVIALEDGREVRSRTVVLATGVTYRRLEAPGVDRLVGRGVFYGAATAEARALGDARACIVGAGNSAGQLAAALAQAGARVTLLVRRNSLAKSMSAYLIAELEADQRVSVLTNSVVEEALGESHLEAVAIRDRATEEIRELTSDALFVMIGAEPQTGWLGASLARDDRGFVLTGANLLSEGRPPEGWPLPRSPMVLETSVPGVFAAGDVRHGSIKRVAGAAGEGAASILLIRQYLNL
jgi:thioredoxin reductase (NADPH)